MLNNISIQGLKKYYGPIHALDGLDMQVEAGAVYGFLGPNGAGKTTTLRILTGLARPTAGQAQVAGVDILKNRGGLAHRIGHLPEEPAFYTWMTPGEFLDYLGRLYGLPAGKRLARTKELLSLVQLEGDAKRRIAGFSRGMRQRLGIAATLIHRPEVLFLDEPASALDPAGRKEVLDLIGNLRGQTTVVMSTHILADVERVCDVVGIIAKGRMLVQAARTELLERYAVPALEVEGEDQAALSVWVESLRSQKWVNSITARNGAFRISVKDIHSARLDLMALAVGAGVGLTRFEEVRPSLEDVFLQLVGTEGAK